MSSNFHPQLIEYIKQNKNLYKMYKNMGDRVEICKNCGCPRSTHAGIEDFCVKNLIWAATIDQHFNKKTFEIDTHLSKTFYIYMRLMGVNLND